MAHELHDSLAQTLASLRFQVRMLAETLEHHGVGDPAHSELARIRRSIDEAHTELRELLTSFRGPVDQRGLPRPGAGCTVGAFEAETPK